MRTLMDVLNGNQQTLVTISTDISLRHAAQRMVHEEVEEIRYLRAYMYGPTLR